MRTPLFILAVAASPLAAQAQLAVNWYTIDCGGGTSTGGAFAVSGTIGQFDASAASAFTGGGFRLTSGFWSGLTVTACGPADIGKTGGVPGADGLLNNNDFIAFIDYFFASNPIADRGVTGGVPGSDGLFNNNDFIVFIDQFFNGCP